MFFTKESIFRKEMSDLLHKVSGPLIYSYFHIRDQSQNFGQKQFTKIFNTCWNHVVRAFHTLYITVITFNISWISVIFGFFFDQTFRDLAPLNWVRILQGQGERSIKSSYQALLDITIQGVNQETNPNVSLWSVRI